MNLESIQSHLIIVEDVDCKGGVVGITLTLKANDLNVKLEISYQLNGEIYEMKYYRNQQMKKHILKGKLIVDEIPNEELVSRMLADENNKISNFTIVSLDFLDVDKKLISRTIEDKTNKLLVDQKVVPDFIPRNQNKVSSVEVELNTTKPREEDDDDEEPDDSKWRFIALDDPEDEEEKKPHVIEENSPLENVSKTVTNIIEKGLEMLEKKQENDGQKKPDDEKVDDKKKSPYTFNEGMS